jgi:hypothetical protein
MTNFDFDFLKELYQEDPQRFHEYTRNVINTFIDSLPEDRQRRAKGIQWKLDMGLRKYKDPVARMNRMVELFWQQVGEFQQILTR